MTTLNLQVGASADDAYQDSGGSADLTYSTPNIGTGAAASSPDRAFGLRFQNVTIPQGATIDSAILTMLKSGAQWSLVEFTWRGEDADNAAAFSTSEDLTARAQTTASVSVSENSNHPDAVWNSLPAGSDMKAIVQEIVDRAGWVSGNALVVLGIGDSTNSFASNTYHMYDSAAANAAKFDITYTVTVGPAITVDYSNHPKISALNR